MLHTFLAIPLLCEGSHAPAPAFLDVAWRTDSFDLRLIEGGRVWHAAGACRGGRF